MTLKQIFHDPRQYDAQVRTNVYCVTADRYRLCNKVRHEKYDNPFRKLWSQSVAAGKIGYRSTDIDGLSLLGSRTVRGINKTNDNVNESV